MLEDIYPGSRFVMMYKDDEGDEIRITHDEEFDEALRIARVMSPAILRIILTPATTETTPTTTTPAQTKAATMPLMPAATATQGALKTLDAIQEKIVANLSELRSLSATFEARKAALAASAVKPIAVAAAAATAVVTEVATSPRIGDQCTELSR
jgi:hypothetical protein